MMMFAPNSLVRQKEGAQENEEEKVGGQRKGEQTGTPTPGADAPTGSTRSGVSDARKGENMDGGVGFNSTGGAEGATDQSYHGLLNTKEIYKEFFGKNQSIY